jgi:hypothetical protein
VAVAITRDEAHAAAVAERAQQAQAIGGHGGKREQGVKHTSGQRGSGVALYLTARIARDRPDVLARMRRGEFRSVRQAAIEAGIIAGRVPLWLAR